MYVNITYAFSFLTTFTFVTGYLRLAELAIRAGRGGEASKWLAQAVEVDADEPDTNICLADIQLRCADLEQAKKTYEKVCVNTRHDARAMIALGNFYFSTLNSDDPKYESNLASSYKFYHLVLTEDIRNVYASVGLGMVIAESQELQAARDIFTRIREESFEQSLDVGINLAHVHGAQNKWSEAEHLYESASRLLIASGHAGKLADVSEWIALSRLAGKRHRESLQSLLNGIHLDPTSIVRWFNVGVVTRDHALDLHDKHGRADVYELEAAVQSTDAAQRALAFVERSSMKKDLKLRAGNLSKTCRVCLFS